MDFTRSTLLPLASGAAKLGFGVGRWGTDLGFKISRTITFSAVQLSAAAVDYGLGWNDPNDGMFAGPTTKIANGAVMMGFNSIEWIVGKGIDLGEFMTQSSLEAVTIAVESISDLYGGTEEASFSLGAFVQLVRRELANPIDPDSLPGPRDPDGNSAISAKSAVQVARSLAAWAAIQTMTSEYQEQQILKGMREVDLEKWIGKSESPREDPPQGTQQASQIRDDPESSPVHITSEIQDEESHARITTAELGLPGEAERFSDSEEDGSPLVAGACKTDTLVEGMASYHHDRRYLRRMSKICLGSYGGAGLVFFGAPLPGAKAHPEAATTPYDQAAVDGEAIQKAMDESNKTTPTASKGKAREWWNTVRGHNDEAIFRHYASIHEDDAIAAEESSDNDPATSPAAIAAERSMDVKKPRFWVLTDHRRREVVLALRGTMSLNELAIDLTCDPVAFSPASSANQSKGKEDLKYHAPGTPRHKVHEGFLMIAQEMGNPSGPVTEAVGTAMRNNDGYSLVLTGHSLGAGVAALLALMWADPCTQMTTSESGLPRDRPLHAFCFAIPCVASTSLSELSRPLITSVVYSYDFVSRLSLGSIRDLKSVSEWLMFAVDDPDQKCNHIVTKALRIKAGGMGMSEEQKQMEADWFLSLRKTLEANMNSVELYPAGKVYHAFMRTDLTPSSDNDTRQIRLFEVTDVAKVYHQIIFASNMLSCHLPHQYDSMLFEHL